MSDPIATTVDMVLSDGQADASPNDILRELDAALQQDIASKAAVLSGEEPPAWVLGGEGGGGFFSIAKRFINFYTDALHRELCDADCGCLKEKYRTLIGSESTKEQVKKLTPTVLDALGTDKDKFSSPLTIAAYVALWLARSGLEQWCAKPRELAGESPAPTPPTEPTVPLAPATE